MLSQTTPTNPFLKLIKCTITTSQISVQPQLDKLLVSDEGYFLLDCGPLNSLFQGEIETLNILFIIADNASLIPGLRISNQAAVL